MGLFTSWRENAELRRQLKSSNLVIADLQRVTNALKQEIRDMEVRLRTTAFERDSALTRMKSMHRRDPKTGRILPKGK